VCVRVRVQLLAYVSCSLCSAVPAEVADDLDAPQDDFGDNQEYKSVDDIEFPRGPDDTRGSSVGLGRFSLGGAATLHQAPARSSLLASEATGGTNLDDGLGMYDEPQGGGGDFDYQGGGGFEPDFEPAPSPPVPPTGQLALFTEESLQDLDVTGVTQRTAKAAAKKRGRCACCVVAL
jgi:hypothetical protein